MSADVAKIDWDHAAAEAWFLGYAERSGSTVAKLRQLGLDVYPCACDEFGCEKWQCLHRDTAERNLRVMGRY